MENTSISWTDNSFNGWVGCSKVSLGCVNCYAEGINKRGGHCNWGPGVARRVTTDTNWKKPLKWDRDAAQNGKRLKVFCSSMADVFDQEAPSEARARLFELIKQTPNLDWQLLTKRPENILRFLPADWNGGYPNVWLGVTIENVQTLRRRLPLLKQVQAKLKFLSCEPLLEDVGQVDLLGIDWVIVGGESGGRARAFDIAWARRIIASCRAQGVAVFVKQLGAQPLCHGEGLRVINAKGRRDRHAGDPEFWPPNLQHLAIRQFPGQEAQ